MCCMYVRTYLKNRYVHVHYSTVHKFLYCLIRSGCADVNQRARIAKTYDPKKEHAGRKNVKVNARGRKGIYFI